MWYSKGKVALAQSTLLQAESYIYKTENVCLFFVPYAWPQFRADLHEIWHMASIYPLPLEPELRAPSIHRCK